jgi:predicted nuclease of predicted toxin-antitoxin system
MKIKLDECVDFRLAIILRQAAHEAVTVQEQGLRGIDDIALYNICVSEGYILVTLDIHFSNVLRFAPEPTSGIVVLRGPDDLFATIRILVRTLIDGLKKGTPEGKLWIIEPGRIRVHEKMEEDEGS